MPKVGHKACQAWPSRGWWERNGLSSHPGWGPCSSTAGGWLAWKEPAFSDGRRSPAEKVVGWHHSLYSTWSAGQKRWKQCRLSIRIRFDCVKGRKEGGRQKGMEEGRGKRKEERRKRRREGRKNRERKERERNSVFSLDRPFPPNILKQENYTGIGSSSGLTMAWSTVPALSSHAPLPF